MSFRNKKDKTNLSRHTRTHTDEKPFECDICENTFSDVGRLFWHRNIHTCLKPYSFDIYKRAFTYSSFFAGYNGSLGIAPSFLKLDSWSPGMGFIPIISTKGINQIKKGKL